MEVSSEQQFITLFGQNICGGDIYKEGGITLRTKI
jgi:hypothetical protein